MRDTFKDYKQTIKDYEIQTSKDFEEIQRLRNELKECKGELAIRGATITNLNSALLECKQTQNIDWKHNIALERLQRELKECKQDYTKLHVDYSCVRNTLLLCESEIERLEKELKDCKKTHEEDLQDLNDKIKEIIRLWDSLKECKRKLAEVVEELGEGEHTQTEANYWMSEAKRLRGIIEKAREHLEDFKLNGRLVNIDHALKLLREGV